MPTLDWIGKKAVVNHHREVPYHVLRCDPELSVGEPGSGNLLVQGDNLLALKALLPYYAGKVKCIYIDPPYNTGNEGWVYNDNSNAPEIREWLGKVVGKEAEDLSRHDKWLCMMYPRLVLLKQLLRQDGAIFVSLDDHEIGPLRLLMDEVFGARNFITCVTWHKRVSPANDAKYFSTDIDYVMVYARSVDKWSPNRLPMSGKQLKNYRNPDNDPRGNWNSAAYTCAKTAAERPNLYYAIRQPNTGEDIWPSKTRVWAYDPTTHAKHVAENMIYWGIDGKSKKPRIKKFLTTAKKVVPRSFWTPDDAGHNQEGRLELDQLELSDHFATPKPTRLLRLILGIASNPGDIVLDSFAGSGTTGHAVFSMNKEGTRNRRFVLVEMDKAICADIAAERLRRVSQGYTRRRTGEPVEVSGLGGGFRFCTLGPPMLDENGQITSDIKFEDLARHTWFCETGEPWSRRGNGRLTPILGTHGDTAVYLLFNGVLGDRTVNGGNVLTSKVLSSLPKHNGPKVIYGEASRLGRERLKREKVVFKQIPYEVKGV